MASTTRKNLPLGTTVKVFRDHPDWDRYEKWWMLRMSLLGELHISTYDIAEDSECPGSPAHPARDLDWIEAQHPGCVFVY